MRTPSFTVYINDQSHAPVCGLCPSLQLQPYTLKPRDFLLPLAFSNFLPFDRTLGLVLEPGTPGAFPKYLSAVRALVGPRRRTALAPFGDLTANWSRVMHSPPALMIRALAVSVNFRAHTVIFGTSKRRASSETVATTTAVLPVKGFMCSTSLERAIGALLRLEVMSLLTMVSLNLDPVLRARNLYNLTKSLTYGLSVLTSFRPVADLLLRPLRSIPIRKSTRETKYSDGELTDISSTES